MSNIKQARQIKAEKELARKKEDEQKIRKKKAREDACQEAKNTISDELACYDNVNGMKCIDFDHLHRYKIMRDDDMIVGIRIWYDQHGKYVADFGNHYGEGVHISVHKFVFDSSDHARDFQNMDQALRYIAEDMSDYV